MKKAYSLRKKIFNITAFKLSLVYTLLTLSSAASEDDTLRKWYIPDHYELQFAGNIGFVSGGIGYSYAHKRLETDLMYGYVPPSFGGHLHSITLKENWIVFKPITIEHYSIDPLTSTLYFNYALGKQFFLNPASQEKYPKRYYDYSSALRIGFAIGGRVSRHVDACIIDKLSLYYELGTYDLAVHNYIFNVSKSGFKGMFSLALGLKITLKD